MVAVPAKPFCAWRRHIVELLAHVTGQRPPKDGQAFQSNKSIQIEQLKHTTCYCLGHLASHLTCVTRLDADALDEVVTSMTHRFNCPQTSSTFLCQRSIQRIGSEQTPGGTPLVARERQSVCSASQGTNCKQPCNTARISQLSVVSQTFRVWK